MPKSAMAVKQIPKALEFQRYVESGSWRCPEGGAHFWVHMGDDTWRCRKCGVVQEIKCPDYVVWNDKLELDSLWGLPRNLDIITPRMVY